MMVDGAGFLGLDPSIVLGGDRRYIRSNIFGDMTIEMVLFISNNHHGCGTVVRQVTLPKL
jgi:hypothetical protein